MNVFFEDIKIDNFVASEYGLFPISFDYNGDEDDDLAMGSETNEEYIGDSTIPLDYGSTHHGKLEFIITFGKKRCGSNEDMDISNFEMRSILRELTGKQHYRDLYFLDDKMHYDEKIHFRVKVIKTERKRICNVGVALIFTLQCDSFWGYTDYQELNYFVQNGQTIYFCNTSDELNDYLYPILEVTPILNVSKLSITNISDNNRITTVNDVKANEKITFDSKNEIICSSTNGRIIANDFNLKFPRLIPGMNELTFSDKCNVKIKYQLLRKAVF